MIIVNTTFHIHESVEANVLAWIRDTYTAAAVKIGLANPMLLRILGSVDEGYQGFALHLCATDLALAVKWSEGVAERLRGIMAERWGEKVLSFQTFLEVIDG